jgi:hypothetical protein
MKGWGWACRPWLGVGLSENLGLGVGKLGNVG